MSGRHQGLVTKPSQAKSRDGRVEFGYDDFVQQHHDAQGEQPFRYRHDKGPHHRVEGVRRNRERDIPSDVLERREYEWHMRYGRGDQVRSRMVPPIGRSEKRPLIDGRVLHMSPPLVGERNRYDYAEYEDYDDEAIRKSKNVYGYDDRIRISKQEYGEGRFLVDNEHGAMNKNLIPVEDGLDPQLVRLHPDHGHGQGYETSSQCCSRMEMQRSKEEDECYQDLVPLEKLYMEKYSKGEEKYMYQPRKSSHPLSPTLQFKDFENQHLLRGVPSTSSGGIRDEFPGGFQKVDTNPFEENPRKPGKLSKTLGAKEYGQKTRLESRKDYETRYEDLKCHECDPYACTWNEHEDYAYIGSESRGKDDPGYISRDALYREGHLYARADSEHKFIRRPSIAKPIVESPIEAEGAQRMYSDNGLREFDISQEEVPGYVDLRRAFSSSKQEADCLDSGYPSVEFGRRASQEIQLSKASDLHDDEISAYDYGRYVNAARTQRERVKSSPELVDPADTQSYVGRADRYADEQVAYNRGVKRKYSLDEEARGFNLGPTVSHKWNTCSGNQQMVDCRAERINISSSGLRSKVASRHKPDLFLEAKDTMDQIYHHKDSVRYGWSDQGKWDNMQKQSVKSFEPERKYMKVHAKSESSKGYGRSDYIVHRSDRYKLHYVGKRSEDDFHMDTASQDGNLSECLKGSLVYDPYEDSEGFKRSVQAAFLMYSKKLNENPPVRKLYKDQGKPGALFCIVCGRSASKVFRDTDGLARHTFMSRKASLRAQHLGLNKAICVLMGWSSELPVDIFTWMPQALPWPEAMAQKEDLIVWQPIVVVHNISLSNINHKEWKVLSLEALEDIIRAKSFIRSKIKICLGYPGDQSVMLVKFLGTFTGLQEAEKLHKYFAEKGRGRADFARAISEMSKSSEPVPGSAREDSKEESLLYGYLGIAEDLDRVDFDTKRRCIIRSKKEIQDIADVPLKTG